MVILQGQFYFKKMRIFRVKCSNLMYALFKYKIVTDRHMSVLGLGVDTTVKIVPPQMSL